MARHWRSLNADGSDASFSPEVDSCFDEDEADLSGDKTETTEFDVLENDDLDVDDRI
jgi:hypothetical protein